MILVGRGNHLAPATATDEIGDPGSRRILAGHNAASRRRANAASGVTLRESHSTLAKAVDIRRLVKRPWIVRTDVHVTEVIGKNEDNVWPGRLCGMEWRDEGQQQGG